MNIMITLIIYFFVNAYYTDYFENTLHPNKKNWEANYLNWEANYFNWEPNYYSYHANRIFLFSNN